MTELGSFEPRVLARQVGAAQLALILLGILGAMFLAQGIDVNMTADVPATADNMLGAEARLRGKAYLALAGLGIGVFVAVGLYLLLRKHGPVLALWALALTLCSAALGLLGSMFAMNAAQLVGDDALAAMVGETEQMSLLGLQAVSDYTSFHLSLVLASAGNAAFFYLLLRSGLIPKWIAGWGVFASLLVVGVMVARDFVPILGSDLVTAGFMVSNLTALVALGLYMLIWGVSDV